MLLPRVHTVRVISKDIVTLWIQIDLLDQLAWKVVTHGLPKPGTSEPGRGFPWVYYPFSQRACQWNSYLLMYPHISKRCTPSFHKSPMRNATKESLGGRCKRRTCWQQRPPPTFRAVDGVGRVAVQIEYSEVGDVACGFLWWFGATGRWGLGEIQSCSWEMKERNGKKKKNNRSKLKAGSASERAVPGADLSNKSHSFVFNKTSFAFFRHCHRI